MPRGFSEDQMKHFRSKLIEVAFDALKDKGVRKTTVGELAKAAGLSTGAFYKFFPSKEALFFTVYDRTEESLKTEVLSMLQAATELSPLALRLTVKQVLRSETMQALFRLMRKEEFDYMLRNTDAALVEQHVQRDHKFAQDALDQLRAKGLDVQIEESLLLDYLFALFVLCYEKEQYARHAEQVIDTFIDTIVATITV